MPLQPAIILRSGPHENECLAHADVLQSLRHHGTDSVRDLRLLCRNKMLRSVGIAVVNDTRNVS